MSDNLSPAMEQALLNAEPGVILKAGPTRAALIRRGLVHRMDDPIMWATLTADGLKVRDNLIKQAEAKASASTEARRAAALKQARDKRAVERADEVEDLRAEFAGAQPVRRLEIRTRLTQLSATVYPDRWEAEEDYQADLDAVAAGQSADRDADTEMRPAVMPVSPAAVAAPVVAPYLNAGASIKPSVTVELPAPSEDLSDLALAEGTQGMAEAVLSRHAASQRPGHTAQVGMCRVAGGVWASPQLLIAIGPEWGDAEGQRIRLVAGEGFWREPLPVRALPVTSDKEPRWCGENVKTSYSGSSLIVGKTAMVGERVYRVQVQADVWPVLIPVQD